MHNSVRTLLTGLVDYAGLFPPAGLGMEGAVRNYAAYHSGTYAWMLGRFVTPIARLPEFEAAKAALPAAHDEPWRLSVLAGSDGLSEREVIAAFNQRHSRAVAIDSVEIKADKPELIRQIGEWFLPQLSVYVEIPVAGDPLKFIESISAAGLRAKVRTGAVTSEGFPSPEHLSRFMTACVACHVPFKATAGLHHPLRSSYRLTYEADSATGLMHGFLNVFLAAAFAKQHRPAAFLTEVLEERSPGAFQITAENIQFRGEEIPLAALADSRDSLAISFGSCSFQEPVDDLKALGLL